MKLSREVAELLKAGVIEQDTADRIEQYYLTKAGPPQNKLVIVFGILGSLLVGTLAEALKAPYGDDAVRYALLVFMVFNAWAAYHYWRAGAFVADGLKRAAEASA